MKEIKSYKNGALKIAVVANDDSTFTVNVSCVLSKDNLVCLRDVNYGSKQHALRVFDNWLRLLDELLEMNYAF